RGRQPARAFREDDRGEPRQLDPRVVLRRRPLRLPAGAIAGGIPAAFLGVFFAYPLASIIHRGLTQDGAFDFPWDVVGSSDTRQVGWFTVGQATASTALTLAAGLPLAWATARLRFRGRDVVRAL